MRVTVDIDTELIRKIVEVTCASSRKKPSRQLLRNSSTESVERN